MDGFGIEVKYIYWQKFIICRYFFKRMLQKRKWVFCFLLNKIYVCVLLDMYIFFYIDSDGLCYF